MHFLARANGFARLGGPRRCAHAHLGEGADGAPPAGEAPYTATRTSVPITWFIASLIS